MNPLYVGIDVSIKSNVAYLMKPDGSKHSSFSVPNTRDGSRQLVKRILSAITSESLTDVVIGLEATSVYGDNLVCFLREDGSLAPYNKKIHVLNPKQVNKFKLSYNDLPKNDYVDSFVIADCLRFGRINKEVYLGDYRYAALKNLTRARFFAVQNLTREKQRFMNQLFKKYSTMAQEKVFSDTFSTTALAVYESFESAETLANMDLHQLTEFIIEKGKNRFALTVKGKAGMVVYLDFFFVVRSGKNYSERRQFRLENDQQQVLEGVVNVKPESVTLHYGVRYSNGEKDLEVRNPVFKP